MYKRITHNIVEEHYDYLPESDSQIKPEMSILKYPDGEVIPASLPAAYRPADTEKKCSNCGAFDPETQRCSRWNSALVRPYYVCGVWYAKS